MDMKVNPGKAEIRRVEREMEDLLIEARKCVSKDDYSEAASVYQEMARLAHSINDRRAVDFCLDAANYAKKAKDEFKAGWSYKCAADYSLASKDFNNAVSFAMKAVEHLSKTDSMYVVQWCYNIMGRASEGMKDYELALKSYKKSLDIEYSDEIQERARKVEKLMSNEKR